MPDEYRHRDLARIKQFCLLDDTFMKVVMKDNIKGAQDIIRVLLMRNDLEVTEVRTQDEWTNLVGHSVRLDVVAKDSAGRWYNIEVQRAADGANAQRARYNVGALDWHILAPGKDYSQLPEVYIIFITETDVLGQGLPVYTIDRFIRETGEPFRDNAHILYANASYQGTDPIGKLMEDFRERDPRKMHHDSLAGPAGFYKNTEGGLNSMCQIMEEVRAEGVELGIRKGRAEGRAEMIRALLIATTEDSLLYDNQYKSLGITAEEIKAARTKYKS